ncbi:MAG: DHH family phosphoesterase [Candidatus Peribacteraceae bacterium]
MPLSPSETQAATNAIEQAERILIVPHANVDPDGLSSALACFSVFRAMGKECTVICPDTLPESLNFLPGFENLETSVTTDQEFVITLDCDGGLEIDKLRYTVEDSKVNIIVVPKKGVIRKDHVHFHESHGTAYDLIVVVDSAELSLLGSFYTENIDLFQSVPVLNVDHHVSNTHFGQLQLIDPTAASATELLFAWFQMHPKWRICITPDIATLLLTGLITDTRSFQNPNTTPKSLEVAAQLLDLGARQQEIIQHVYKTKPLSTLKIWGRALNHIQVDSETRIVWSAVSREDLLEMGATSKETHGILDELISTVPDADVHVLFTELEDSGMKASMRSSPAIDVNVAAGRLFGGGGHARAAGFKVKQYANFQVQVMECIRSLSGEMQRQREEGQGPREPLLRGRIEEVPTKDSTRPTPSTPPTDMKKTKQIDVVEELNKKREEDNK